jgi:hypothetical protein
MRAKHGYEKLLCNGSMGQNFLEVKTADPTHAGRT